MYEYHGWLATYKTTEIGVLKKRLDDINGGHPISVSQVNGRLHISFSSGRNRDLGNLKQIVNYVIELKLKLTGVIYINDSVSEHYNSFEIIKIFEDKVVLMNDKNFTLEETSRLFE